MKHVLVSFSLALVAVFVRRAVSEVKLETGRHIFFHADAARLFRERLTEQEMRPKEIDAFRDAEIDRFIDELLSAADAPELLVGMHQVIGKALATAYRHHIDHTDPITDVPTIRLLRRVLTDYEPMLEWAEGAIAAYVEGGIEESRLAAWRWHLQRLLASIGGAIFIGLFLWHLVYLAIRVARSGKRFEFFGPTSLVPNLQDLKDIILMFKWFFGRAPRPQFDRWTYWEKFDYWAVFWGVAVIGGSGLILWFPAAVATVLPGWVFNVATIFHGEEAILAAVFLFTVHFFNNHFRPDKFPVDIVMFTGRVPLEEFKREHALEYKRLVESGELAKYLVDAPSRPFTVGSKLLGFTLITIGLVLLVLVVSGWVNGVLLA